MTVIPIVIGTLGTIPEGFVRGLVKLGNGERTKTIIEVCQNTKKNPGDVRKRAVTQRYNGAASRYIKSEFTEVLRPMKNLWEQACWSSRWLFWKILMNCWVINIINSSVPWRVPKQKSCGTQSITTMPNNFWYLFTWRPSKNIDRYNNSIKSVWHYMEYFSTILVGWSCSTCWIGDVLVRLGCTSNAYDLCRCPLATGFLKQCQGIIGKVKAAVHVIAGNLIS